MEPDIFEQFINVLLKPLAATLVLKSNNPDGMDVTPVHPEKSDERLVTAVLYFSNKAGMEVRLVQPENADDKDVTAV